MPQTFQDTIKVVGELGLTYIYIDALCNIQEDQADWQRESSAMIDICRHTFVTIAAVKSDACTKSFLDRNPAFTAWQRYSWIFQEHHLPPRILYFGNHVVYF
ncbi:hypothetical protein EJ08DRAFT_575878, partial [Tothia fuscella]